MSEDPRDQLRSAIMQYARSTGRLSCEVVMDDLAGMIGEIAAAGNFDLERIANDTRWRIMEAGHVMAEEMRRDLERARPLGGKH